MEWPQIQEVKPTIKLTTEVTQQVDVRVRPHVQQMLKERCEEYAEQNRREKTAKSRKKRIEQEVESLMVDEGQGEALLAGTAIDGHKVKMVCGSSSRLNLDKLKRKFGLTQADIDSCKDESPSTPYVRITAPGEGRSEEDGR